MTEQKQEPVAVTVKAAAKSLSGMITEWVQSGIDGGTDWRNGLDSIIAKRLARFSVVGPAPDLAAENARLREAITWCLDRDQRNGSLPEAYATKLRTALNGGDHG